MVVWTPEQWGRELDEFAVAVREKKFNKIPYGDWKMMWHWQDFPSTTDIYLKLKDNSFMFSPYGKSDYITFVKNDANWPFIEYLQSKYYAILGYAESYSRYPIINLAQPHLTTDMSYAPSPYSAITTSDVISNSNLATTITCDSNIVFASGTYQTATIDNEKEKKDMNFFKNFEFGP